MQIYYLYVIFYCYFNFVAIFKHLCAYFAINKIYCLYLYFFINHLYIVY